MQVATAPQLRKSLELADQLAKAGIRFVPMPIKDDADGALLMVALYKRIAALEKSVTDGGRVHLASLGEGK